MLAVRADIIEPPFTGKERDTESWLDYFEARYLSSNLGRFMTPDPILQNELRRLNPQRWNKYSYAIDSPLVFDDPTGKDAAYVAFMGKVAGLGHAGELSIHKDGTATYSSFGPKGDPKFAGPGGVKLVTDLPKVQFGTDGLPTLASYDALSKAVAGIEGADPSSVAIDYFKTSDSEASALDQYFKTMKEASNANKLTYVAPVYNCADYALTGLAVAGAIPSFEIPLMSNVPNILFFELIPQSDASVTVTYTNTAPNGESDTHTF